MRVRVQQALVAEGGFVLLPPDLMELQELQVIQRQILQTEGLGELIMLEVLQSGIHIQAGILFRIIQHLIRRQVLFPRAVLELPLLLDLLLQEMDIIMDLHQLQVLW
jgi:hypothetical protein